MEEVMSTRREFLTAVAGFVLYRPPALLLLAEKNGTALSTIRESQRCVFAEMRPRGQSQRYPYIIAVDDIRRDIKHGPSFVITHNGRRFEDPAWMHSVICDDTVEIWLI